MGFNRVLLASVLFMSSSALAIDPVVTRSAYGAKAKDLITSLQMIHPDSAESGDIAYELNGLKCFGSDRYAYDLSDARFGVETVFRCEENEVNLTTDPAVGLLLVRALRAFGVPSEGAAGSFSVEADVECRIHADQIQPDKRFGCEVSYETID